MKLDIRNANDLAAIIRRWEALDLSPEEKNSFIQWLREEAPHPGGKDIVKYPQWSGLSRHATPEEIAERVFSWRPRVMAMAVGEVLRAPGWKGHAALRLTAPGIEAVTQVGVPEPCPYQVGDVLAVALHGWTLSDGQQVRGHWVGPVYSDAVILERTAAPPGTDLSTSFAPGHP